MSYKIGETIKYVGEVRLEGVLQNLSAWVITAQAQKDKVGGASLGNFTRTDPSLGVFQLTLPTAGLTPCQVFFDVRIVKPDGSVAYTDTDTFPLLKAVTPP